MMKIIIDIPKKVYDQICDQNLDGIMATAIRCGKPLLKDTLPSAQPERKKGKWIYHESVDVFECSVCGRQMARNIFDYCPWCGARMVRGEEKE